MKKDAVAFRIFCSILVSLLVWFCGSTIYGMELSPDESGKIPIITYHRIGDKDSEFTRSYSAFYNDLVNFKKQGFWPITLEELISKKINVPKGKIPVLLTFDDSSETQFRYSKTGRLDPNCAIALMEKFKKENPDYPIKAVFFVMPGAAYPNNLFGQPRHNKEKLEFLKQNDYEMASHTYWHANMSIYHARIEEQLGKTQSEIEKYLPGYRLRALALPFGAFPPKAERTRLRKGSYHGTSYVNELVFDYSNRLSESVYSVTFDPDAVHRLHGFQGVFDKLLRQRREEPQIFFVSDGKPDVITVRATNRSKVKVPQGFNLEVY